MSVESEENTWSLSYCFYCFWISFFLFCAKDYSITSRHYFDSKFVEIWDGVFQKIALNGLLLASGKTGSSSIPIENQFSNFRQKEKKIIGAQSGSYPHKRPKCC